MVNLIGYAIFEHTSDTGPRRHDLQPNTEPSSATKMRSQGIVESEKDFDELDGRGGLRILAHGADFIEFLFNLFIVGSTHMLENLSCFVKAAYGGEVSRRVRDQSNTSKQQQRWKALKSKKKSPANLR